MKKNRSVENCGNWKLFDSSSNLWRKKLRAGSVLQELSIQTESNEFLKQTTKRNSIGGGLHGTEEAYLLLAQQPRVRFLAFPRIFLFMLLIFIGSTT